MEQKKNKFSTVYRRPEILSKTERVNSRRRVNYGPLKFLFYLLVLIVIIYGIFFSSFFKITKVEVIGIRSVEISDYIYMSLKGGNILFLMPGKYLKDLSKKFPVLQEAKIVRGLPSTVKIIASERKQVLVWCSMTCVEIDSYGFAYQEVLRPTDKVVLDDKTGVPVKVGDRVVSTQFINFYLGTLEELDKMGVKIVEARIDETTFKVNFKTTENWEIVLDSSESLKNQMSALKQVLETNRADIKEYIDVRVPGTVYVK